MKKHLAIEFSRLGALFVALNGTSVVQTSFIKFHTVKPDEIKAILNTAFSDHPFLSEDFDEITLAWNSNKSTLVPNSIFAESDPASIFRLCFGDAVSSNEIDYNRISEVSIVNVFEIPVWVKSYFVIKFPRIVIQHVGTHTVRKGMDSNAFKAKATVLVHPDFIQLTLMKHNELQFYSFFDARSAEDVMYHLMFALQQKELISEKGTIELVPGLGQDDTKLNEIKEGLGKIKDLNGYAIVIEPHFVAQAQQLCV